VNNPNRLEALLLRYENTLYRAALAILGNVQDAEDAVQDTFLRYLERAPEFQDQGHEKAWLLRVTINGCRSRLRRAWRHPTLPLLEEIPAAEPEAREALEELFSLPAKERIAIHLFYYEGYQTREIAAMTGEPEGTVRSRLSRARKALGKALNEGRD
jgi:RNA polymerase sigma factor (sigma-70 family)